ncbi:hypothetical protein GCM10027405_17770 [Arthrobacter alkaliphilus]|uniref:hypothetical protein n=1 Tax=Arthrobacter alkaliphilus TaxID=369936 RepID=UPI001F314C73|nr:hypothetical protein [Arthrobacter alkaliphilus]
MKIRQSDSSATAGNSLAAYLHSHLIAAAAGERLFGQAAKTWKGSARAETIARLRTEVRTDKTALEAIAASLGMGMPGYKKPFAWAGALLGSLGPVNLLHIRTGAAEQLELEALISAVTGKSLLWKTLLGLSGSDPRIRKDEVALLLERAAGQIRELTDLLAETIPERFSAAT